MSASTSISPETPITVKATFDGNTRRFKVALKEVGPSVFQGKLRELLAIPQTQDVKFERYSDSAACYVTLDPQNTAVYKQLFRAAKAKLKLRIKITTVTNDAPPAPVAPVTQGDASFNSSVLPPSYSTPYVNVIPNNASSASVSAVVDPAQIDDAVAKAVSSYCSSTEFTAQLRDTVREEVSKEVEKKQPDQNDLINLSKSTESSPLETKLAVDELMTSLANACAYAVYCNSCSDTIRGMHYHCEECDLGDFDLCEGCIAQGLHCYDRAHWLTKRNISNGQPVVQEVHFKAANNSRYCNACVGRFSDEQCVVCQDCKDFDLCIACLRAGEHGHDPRHNFARAHKSIILTKDEEALLARGRNVRHAALCDSCDNSIYGIRHKCIDCPDWDYCNDCIDSAHELHPGHRFVPILDNTIAPFNKSVPLSSVIHSGVYCDGPVCEQYGRGNAIRGPRFKCAICPDTDFCATCEASPLNRHNSSHPLIKFKTPIRNVHVTTTDNTNTVMGDLLVPEAQSEKKKTELVVTATDTATQVQTIADVKPTEEFAAAPEPEVIDEKVEEPAPAKGIAPVLSATFVHDTIPDDSVIPVGEEFTKSWYMKNTGTTAWPAGVTVKFVGGDYMFVKTAEAELEATVTETEVQPGETAIFSVNLSATWPAHVSYVSYWKLTTLDGTRFGDSMWCSIFACARAAPSVAEGQEDQEEDRHSEAYSSESVVDVNSVKAESVKDEKEDFENAAENMVRSQASSEMVFPKLEVESPVHSLEQLPSPSRSVKAEETPSSTISESSHKTFSLSEVGDVEEEIDISSIEGSEGFMTDEEYDVLCASDEEFVECERDL
ncbi:hypothetical protein FN846DRAFT_949516 [Sphaerosporella brunnea]|uniref:ZZ-type domain-containing protein n=1 Tax=Sphaerosporella brunnea TaxID=1250544 RepID=A0A5J5EX48_9PEZI|nr:hypothetical protein FN846DRAFT_949516 [Sphaerosporella brunnea]